MPCITNRAFTLWSSKLVAQIVKIANEHNFDLNQSIVYS